MNLAVRERVLLRGMLLGLWLLTVDASSRGAGPVDFAKEIEPLLIKRCSECHGVDAQKGGLRLDRSADARQGGKSGHPAVVPGKSAASELIARITATDPDDRMPPKGPRLTEAEVARLRRWIDEGATWPETAAAPPWSYLPPIRPVPPAVASTGLVRNEIDRFVLARLEREGLTYQPEADRATLIRRVSLDVTGLPPAWSEVEAFVNDTSADAYERLVDRLLASRHYGEHIARWWLDLARYADSNGYQVDLTRSMWPYRDWVINAFNRNMPFNQFTIEQLAGDLLPNPTREQRIATGFNRNTKINDEGGGDAEEYRTKAVKDRVATVGTTWLGLTLMCSECHSHKYDPLSHEDYYRVYAIFNQTTDGGNYNVAPTLEAPAPDRSRQAAYLRDRIAATQTMITGLKAGLPAEQESWEKHFRGHPAAWQTLQITNVFSNGGSSYTNLPDGSVLATGVNPIYDTITIDTATVPAGVRAIRLEVLADPSLPKKGPGRWGATGNFILDELTGWHVPTGAVPGSQLETNLAFSGAFADWEQEYYRAEHAVDRNPKSGWAIAPKTGESHFLVATLASPIAQAGRLGFRFEHYHGNSHAIGRFRFSVTTNADPVRWWPVSTAKRAIIEKPAATRTPEEARELADFYRTVSPRLRVAERELARLQARLSAVTNTKGSTLVMQEGSKPRETFIHVRGNFLERGAPVTPGFPAVFGATPTNTRPNRLDLARWLVSPEQPLTPRVTVNRLWERFFGTGIVKTSEDLGRQAETPSHPELLDWLAVEFRSPLAAGATAWDLQRIQKLMLMSAAYRQSAVSDAGRRQRDPENRLLSRGPRFRLDGETLRDQALFVSGLLVPDVGGPSVYPVQVANLWKELGFLRPEIGMDEWPVSEGPDLYRRAVYTFWRRVCTYPMFATFDAPSRDVCLSRRPRTNTPLQALAALNETTLLEAARVFASRILREGGASEQERIEFAWRTCVGRQPTPVERERVAALLASQLAGYKADPAAARMLVSVGSAPVPAAISGHELAAWTMVANILLNLDEVLTKG